MMFRNKYRDEAQDEDIAVSGTLPFPKSEEEETTLIKTVGWISAGLGAVALGLFIGRELRQRYQFNRRTPYDMYAHSGDEQDVDFGLGIWVDSACLPARYSPAMYLNSCGSIRPCNQVEPSPLTWTFFVP